MDHAPVNISAEIPESGEKLHWKNELTCPHTLQQNLHSACMSSTGHWNNPRHQTLTNKIKEPPQGQTITASLSMFVSVVSHCCFCGPEAVVSSYFGRMAGPETATTRSSQSFLKSLRSSMFNPSKEPAMLIDTCVFLFLDWAALHESQRKILGIYLTPGSDPDHQFIHCVKKKKKAFSFFCSSLFKDITPFKPIHPLRSRSYLLLLITRTSEMYAHEDHIWNICFHWYTEQRVENITCLSV